MTTIAWDGKTLSGDRCSSYGGTPVSNRKVFRIKSPDGVFLFGAAGKTHECHAYHQWLIGEPLACVLTEISVMMINDSGGVWIRNESMVWVPMSRKQWALGSGADYALGAMAAGKTSRQAVRIAMGLDINTGLGVDTVSI